MEKGDGWVVFDDKVISSRQLIQSFSKNLETVKIAWASDDEKVMILRVNFRNIQCSSKILGKLLGVGHLPLRENSLG